MAESIGTWWRRFLREMKKAGLKVEDMPPDVAESSLKIHQEALMEIYHERYEDDIERERRTR